MTDPNWQPISIDSCNPGTPAWVLVLIGAGSVLFLAGWVYGVWVWRKKRRKA